MADSIPIVIEENWDTYYTESESGPIFITFYAGADEPPAPGELIMAKKLPLDLGQIWNESLENRQLCEELGDEFDGWGAAVVK